MSDPKRPKRPRDINQLAYELVQEATRQQPAATPVVASKKNQAAVELGKLGAEKGGKARAEKLSPERRKAIAQKAAKARWDKKTD